MGTFRLYIRFTNEQLNNIYAVGANIIVAKPAEGNPAPNVAWQAIKPFQNNKLEWTEDYGIYVSNSEMVHGARLDQLSSTPIPSGTNKLYTLEPSGAISGPAVGGADYSYVLLNAYANKPYMTVGLFQDATLNGTKIIGNATSAVPVLLASTAVMTPINVVYIWMQLSVESNTIVTTVTSQMTKLAFGGNEIEHSVVYDSSSGKFIQ